MDEVQTVSLAGGVKEVTVIPHGRNTRRPSTVTVQQYHLSLIIHNSLVFFFFLQGRVVNISFCRSLDPDVTALAVETCMSTFAFYHKFWHTYMLIFAGTNTVLLLLILFRKKLPMRDMNRRYFYVWLNVITYCMATGNTLQCYCSYNHIFSVLQEQSILTFYKRSLPFSKIGHYCVGVGDRHSDYSVYYVVQVVPYSVLCSVLYV